MTTLVLVRLPGWPQFGQCAILTAVYRPAVSWNSSPSSSVPSRSCSSPLALVPSRSRSSSSSSPQSSSSPPDHSSSENSDSGAAGRRELKETNCRGPVAHFGGIFWVWSIYWHSLFTPSVPLSVRLFPFPIYPSPLQVFNSTPASVQFAFVLPTNLAWPFSPLWPCSLFLGGNASMRVAVR